MTIVQDQQTNLAAVDPQDSRRLIEVVEAHTPGDSRLDMCIQCGTCGGSCPSGPDMEHTPRQVFALLRAGFDQAVLESNTPWFCVSCYLCYTRCPQDIKITDIMYTLKTLAISEGKVEVNQAADFSETFVGYVEQYGRSFEFGLATRHFLRHHPMSISGTLSMGTGMLSKRRMDMTPHRIEGVDQLRSILNRAKQLEDEL